MAASTSASRKVLLPVADRTDAIQVVTTINVLRRAGADVVVACVEEGHQICAHRGVKIVADCLISDCTDDRFYMIFLPGESAGADTLRHSSILEGIVKKHAADEGLCAAIGADLVLGAWGLLKGLKGTRYTTDQLSPTSVESKIQQHGKIMTCLDPCAAMEFAVYLVEQLFGKQKADEVSGLLVMPSVPKDKFIMTDLNPIDWKCDNPQILVPIANGTEEMEAVIIIDVLRQAKANVVVASVEDNLQIVASQKVKLIADVLLDEAVKSPYNIIVLPGGLVGAKTFAGSETLVNLLENQRDSNKPYGAICASLALVLEPHGLLKGKLLDQSKAENRVLIDGNLIASSGPGTCMQFALAIVEKFFGHGKALEIEKVRYSPASSSTEWGSTSTGDMDNIQIPEWMSLGGSDYPQWTQEVVDNVDLVRENYNAAAALPADVDVATSPHGGAAPPGGTAPPEVAAPPGEDAPGEDAPHGEIAPAGEAVPPGGAVLPGEDAPPVETAPHGEDAPHGEIAPAGEAVPPGGLCHLERMRHL